MGITFCFQSFSRYSLENIDIINFSVKREYWVCTVCKTYAVLAVLQFAKEKALRRGVCELWGRDPNGLQWSGSCTCSIWSPSWRIRRISECEREEGRFSRPVVHSLGCILESPWGAITTGMCALWAAPLELLINLVWCKDWVTGFLNLSQGLLMGNQN